MPIEQFCCQYLLSLAQSACYAWVMSSSLALEGFEKQLQGC